MKNKSKLLAIAAYCLPVLFFLISYFLLTSSGEDIFQGANSFRTGVALNPIGDAINAFDFNSRITDMYAWSIIDYYDYQFTFGPDTIFRLIDVLLAVVVFYLATYLVLGRKPKLIVKDALLFCLIFFTFIITPFGRSFYHEFSMIHNYVPLALISLIIVIPYLKLLAHQPISHQKLLNFLMPFFGLYFGMAATITPLAFLMTIAAYCLIRRKTITRPPLWFFTGIVSTIIGFLICWLAGSGVDHYTNPITSLAFDYVPISNILSDPLTNIPKILWHEIYNFGIVLLPLLCLLIACLVIRKHSIKFKKLNIELKKLIIENKNVILVFSIFIVIHILGASLIKAPFRLLIPAYLAGIIIILRLFSPRINSKFIGSAIIVFTALTLIVHTVLLANYHHKAGEILTEIKNSPEASLCIKQSRTKPSKIQIIDLAQANILVDWGYPEPIYGKNITFCKE